MARGLSGWLLALGVAGLAVMLFGRLAHPLLWQDEGETVMFATRVLEHGYPKVHGERNVVYEFGPNIAIGVKESVDAYIGKTWGDFYFALPGLLWARGVDDPYVRTFRLRLPFALAGAAGLGVMLCCVLPAVAPRRRLIFAALFLGVCGVSISLLLHLREARYYALLVLVLGAVLALHLRRGLAPRERWVGHALALGFASFLLFQVFHVAWFAATGLLVLDAGQRAWRGGQGDRPRRLARELAPHALAALLVLPWIVFLETFQVARGFATHLGLTFQGYATNLGRVLVHFAIHELLLPAALCRVAVAWRRRVTQRPAQASDELAARLLAFCAGYAAIGCLNPLIYERYFVVLGPLLSLAFLLDASCLVEHTRRRGAMAAALALLAVLCLVPRVDAVCGHIAELREPVGGPLDFAVPHLRERYADTASLVIATNYEAHPLMYYLGSRVVVGLALNNIANERGLLPDVVIPRRRWPRALPELRRFLSRADYREESLPVQDTHYNHISALSASPATPDTHRFVTPRADAAHPGRLRVYHRVEAHPN